MYSLTLKALLASMILIKTSIAGYVLTDDYEKDSFFGNFTAFTEEDPTNGFVQFVDYENGIKQEIIGSASNDANSSYLGVDHTTSSTSGRASHRITSNKAWNLGLFIADISHMPVGCGTWPAFWMLGPGTWPAGGEIDIIEGVNNAATNQMTLHTSSGCSVSNAPEYSSPQSSFNTTNCDVNATGQKKNAGCGIIAKDTNTFGAGFNAIGGGVYATEWTDEAIQIWFFPRSSIPADITSNTPDTSKWETPLSHFCGNCDIKSHFQNMNIIFDTTFCGQWAGDPDVWKQSTCGSKADTCNAYVQENPTAFVDAYWLVNSVKVYQQSGSGTTKRGVRMGVEDW
ncbi:hypothetical protein P7C71_g1722, partial [Lecanoromycetidae sp. Uapishka_2]